MPAKNVIKLYSENGYYHIYNRGLDKRIIFQDSLDYRMLLSYLKNYLLPPPILQVRPVRRSDIYLEIDLLVYCLMPNHFHLLIKQKSNKAIIKFMRCLTNAYTRYFNNRNKRIGPLFQGCYKAILIESESYLLQLSKYIHRNPLELYTMQYRSHLLDRLSEYPYSSYDDYLGIRKTLWVKPQEILSYFASEQQKDNPNLSYKGFVEKVTDTKFDLSDFIIEDSIS